MNMWLGRASPSVRVEARRCGDFDCAHRLSARSATSGAACVEIGSDFQNTIPEFAGSAVSLFRLTENGMFGERRDATPRATLPSRFCVGVPALRKLEARWMPCSRSGASAAGQGGERRCRKSSAKARSRAASAAGCGNSDDPMRRRGRSCASGAVTVRFGEPEIGADGRLTLIGLAAGEAGPGSHGA